MRIDPRQFTLDAVERRIIARGLEDFVADLERRIKRSKRAELIEAYESDAAQAQDLLERIRRS